MSDVVVYNQSELEAELEKDSREITLCAGEFIIPKTESVIFKRIGPVRVSVLCSRREADEAEMSFENIFPEYKLDYAISSRASMAVVAAVSGSYIDSSYIGSGGSYIGSGYTGSGGTYISSSYGSGGSGAGSYFYEYMLKNRTSSQNSFAQSYSILGSSIMCGEYKTEYSECKAIRVFGYGINLI